MRNRRRIGLLVAAVLLGTVLPALSHHSASMFEYTKQVSITGAVAKFNYSNPHGHLFIDVKDESGQTVNYWIEMVNIPGMIARGIDKTTFKPGEKVTISIYPLRDGRPGGRYIGIVGADGKLSH